MNDIQIFNNPEFGEIRTVEIDGEPWLVGKDVATVLGYSNTRDAIDRHVDSEDKNTVVNPDGNKGNPNMTIINESGLYSLVLSSKLPGAKKFKRWVTSEVLPSIRKSGGYHSEETPLTAYEKLRLHLERDQLSFQKANLFHQMSQEYEGTYRQVLNAYAAKEMAGEFVLPLPKLEEQTYTAGEIGKKLGISGNKVGVLTNHYNLKTEEYGAWFADKAKGHNKEVQSFRYYEKVVPVLRAILEQTADKSKKT